MARVKLNLEAFGNVSSDVTLDVENITQFPIVGL